MSSVIGNDSFYQQFKKSQESPHKFIDPFKPSTIWGQSQDYYINPKIIVKYGFYMLSSICMKMSVIQYYVKHSK